MQFFELCFLTSDLESSVIRNPNPDRNRHMMKMK